jgi:hypothetical protein
MDNLQYPVTVETCCDDQTTPEFKVAVLKNTRRKKWRSKPDSYWFQRLVAEVGELGGALAGDHPHPPDWELIQIASICINWLEMRDARRYVEARLRKE